MRKVQCHECGKRYDFDVDDFCPKCGAFTQPARLSRIGMDGAVIRADGINEQNHEKTFVHREYHGENQKRRGSVLEGGNRERELRAASRSAYQNIRSKIPKRGSATGAALDIFSEVADVFHDLF